MVIQHIKMKNNLFNKSICLLIACVLCTSLTLQTVNATYDKQFFANNDILFYDPTDTGCSNTNTVAGGDITYKLPATEGGTGNEEEIRADGTIPSTGEKVTFSELAKSLSQEYRDYAINMRWTYVGWTWNGHSKVADSEQASWFRQAPRIVLVTNPETGKSIYAAALESGPAPWTGVTNKSSVENTERTSWMAQDDGIGAGYVINTPSWYTGRVSGLTPTASSYLGDGQDIQSYYNKKGPKLTYQWAANQNVTPGPTTDTAISNNCSGDSVTGNKIADTAISYVTEKNGASDIYKQAVAQYSSGKDYTDCGRFVGTVMRASGADPNYPQTGTSVQYKYVSTSDKYEIIQFSGQGDDILKPGDILLITSATTSSGYGHTSIWTGTEKKLASASLGSHTPQLESSASWFSKLSGSVIARLK